MDAEQAYQLTYGAAVEENMIRRRVRQCTCEIYGRDDPDCELHHPEMLEDESARRLALQYYFAGHEAAREMLLLVNGQ